LSKILFSMVGFTLISHNNAQTSYSNNGLYFSMYIPLVKCLYYSF